MRQQINLYQATLRAQPKVLTATTAAAALALVTLVLLLLWSYGQWQVSQLQHDLNAMQLQQQHQTEALSLTDSLRGNRANPLLLQAQLKTLDRELAQRRHAMELLRAGAAGESGGFAARLEALARHPLNGVWLDHLVLASGSGVQSLSGGTLDAALVPRYLQGLASEPALSGTRFDDFRIEGRRYAELASEPTDVNNNAEALATKNKASTSIRFHAVNTVPAGSGARS